MMTFEQIFSSEAVANAALGGFIGTAVALGILFVIIIIAASYIYFALAWQTIARKLRYKKDWIAWIPIANFAMILQLGGFHWAWIFLMLIPIFGWVAFFVLMIIATWRVFELRGYPGWFSLSLIIPYGAGAILYLLAIGFVAWKGKTVKMAVRRLKKKRRK